jgi:hypothetical protein
MIDTCDVGQMLISGRQRALSVSSSQFDPKRFKNLVVASIIKHNLPFQFVE